MFIIIIIIIIIIKEFGSFVFFNGMLLVLHVGRWLVVVLMTECSDLLCSD